MGFIHVTFTTGMRIEAEGHAEDHAATELRVARVISEGPPLKSWLSFSLRLPGAVATEEGDRLAVRLSIPQAEQLERQLHEALTYVPAPVAVPLPSIAQPEADAQ